MFKNNAKIGRDGWRYISTFIAMCRSLKSMDLSKVPFPQPLAEAAPPSHTPNHLTRTSTTSSNSEVSCVLSKAIGERLAGREFELLNIAECGFPGESLAALKQSKPGLKIEMQ